MKLFKIIKRKEKAYDPFDKGEVMNKLPPNLINPTKLYKYYYGKNMPKISFSYIKHIWKTQVLKNRTLLVKMLLRNGKTDEFIITPTRPIFEYSDGMYVIDTDFLEEHIGSGYKYLQYHQDISIPLKFDINIKKVLDDVKNNETTKDIVKNINPNTLKDVVNSTVIQKVIAGGELEKQYQTLMYLMMGQLGASILMLIVIGATLAKQ